MTPSGERGVPAQQRTGALCSRYDARFLELRHPGRAVSSPSPASWAAGQARPTAASGWTPSFIPKAMLGELRRCAPAHGGGHPPVQGSHRVVQPPTSPAAAWPSAGDCRTGGWRALFAVGGRSPAASTAPTAWGATALTGAWSSAAHAGRGSRTGGQRAAPRLPLPRTAAQHPPSRGRSAPQPGGLRPGAGEPSEVKEISGGTTASCAAPTASAPAWTRWNRWQARCPAYPAGDFAQSLRTRQLEQLIGLGRLVVLRGPSAHRVAGLPLPDGLPGAGRRPGPQWIFID